MYYLLYGLLRLLSFLPFGALHALSSGIAFLLHRVIGYRREVIQKNIATAFPEKTPEEREKIAARFYRNFTDTFIETIKVLDMTNEEIRNRFTANVDEINGWKNKEQNVTVVTGHYFNWEWANLSVSGQLQFPFLGVYMPIKNKTLDKIFYDLRKRTGTVLIPATRFKETVSPHLDKKNALILVADQSPANPARGFWVNFFGKPASFVRGPETNARVHNTAVFYANFYPTARGRYHCELELVTDDPNAFEPGALTALLVKKTEACIRRRPDNYLWSHRRWKHPWKPEYGDVFADQREGK